MAAEEATVASAAAAMVERVNFNLGDENWMDGLTALERLTEPDGLTVLGRVDSLLVLSRRKESRLP